MGVLAAPEPHRHGGMFPVAGSFMSFQIPARPDCTCAALSSPHQVRASSVTKSGKARVARPDLADVDVAALGPAQHVTLDGLVEDPVARVVLHARVDDRDHPETLVGQRRSSMPAGRGTARCPR